MKHFHYFLFVLFLISSCQSPADKYEKLIARYAQTSREGIFTDCEFKAIEIKELAPVTVADSIKILEEEFDNNKAEQINSISSHIKYAETNLIKEEKARFRLPQVIDIYKKRISIEKALLDSVENSVFINQYQGSDPGKILLQPVECCYSYVFPAGNPRQERTDIFYFTPDLQKITQQVQVKQK